MVHYYARCLGYPTFPSSVKYIESSIERYFYTLNLGHSCRLLVVYALTITVLQSGPGYN